MLALVLTLTLSSAPGSNRPTQTDLQMQMLSQEIKRLQSELTRVGQQNSILEGENGQLRNKINQLEQELLVLRSQAGQLPVGEAAQMARENAVLNYARACIGALEMARIDAPNMSLQAYQGAACHKLIGADAARFATIAGGTVHVDDSVLDGYRLVIN